jgi:hypothetical protein
MMTCVDLRGESDGRGGDEPSGKVLRTGALFAVFADDGFGWHQIGQPHSDAHVACRTAALYVHLLRPDLDLGKLEALATAAAPVLDAGMASVTVIDDRHRVDRIEPVPGSSPVAALSSHMAPNGMTAPWPQA